MTEKVQQIEGASADQSAHISSLIADLESRTQVLASTLNSIADGVIVSDLQGTLTHFNPAAEQMLGLGKLDVISEAWSDAYGFFKPDGVTPFPSTELPLSRSLRGESVDAVEMISRHPGRPEGAWLSVSSRPVLDAAGQTAGGVVVFRDIGDRKRWEKELEHQLVREREKNLTLERMRHAMQELSTPVLEVWDDVLALPVIGIVDSKRSADMMERLLREVEEKQCRFVIIDITGVEVIDTATADHFIRIVNAVQILGARCILTGARGAVAQTLASLGVDLGSLTTLRNLKHALRECIRTMEDGNRQPRLLDLFGRRTGHRE
jgi:rsbT co-antagonist protein RsbR